MSPLDNQLILSLVEDRLNEQFPDHPDKAQQSLSYAADLLYGSNEIPGISSSENDQTSVSDYSEFAQTICHDPQVSDYFYGDQATDPLFYEARDQLQTVLQQEMAAEIGLRRFGDCSPLRSLPQEEPSTNPFPTDQPSTGGKKNKNPYSVYILGTPYHYVPKKRTPPPKPEPLTGRAFCKKLEKDIVAGGAYLLYVGDGFACEYNYDANRVKPILIGQDGQEVDQSTIVFSSLPKRPLPKPEKFDQDSAQQQSSSERDVSDPALVAHPLVGAPKGKENSISYLIEQYMNGDITQAEVEYRMRYRSPENPTTPLATE